VKRKEQNDKQRGTQTIKLNKNNQLKTEVKSSHQTKNKFKLICQEISSPKFSLFFELCMRKVK
jgi:hypothetical protein